MHARTHAVSPGSMVGIGGRGLRQGRPGRRVLSLLLLLLASSSACGFLLPPPPTAGAAASRRPLWVPAAANGEGGAEEEPIYQGFWREGLAMLQEAFPTTLERVEDIPPELATAQCTLPNKGKPGGAAPAGAGSTVVDIHAYRVPGVIRLARAAVLRTTPPTLPPQVLNFVILPDPSLDVPILGADLVQLPGGHLIVLDFQPVAPPASDTSLAAGGAFQKQLAQIRAKYAGGVLPDGGDNAIPEAAKPFFSPHFLFTRVEPTPEGTEAVRTKVRDAYRDYLALYLELLQEAARQGPIQDAARAAEVRRGHVSYMTYRAENDPARGMLTRMFGAEWTERLIHEVLFDWAERKK